MYKGGLSTRDISKFLENLYGTRYSPAGIRRLTDVLEEEVKAWKKDPWKSTACPLYRCHLKWKVLSPVVGDTRNFKRKRAKAGAPHCWR